PSSKKSPMLRSNVPRIFSSVSRPTLYSPCSIRERSDWWMPMRSASSTWVSLRWRRSCLIFRPTSSTCAGFAICGLGVPFMLYRQKLQGPIYGHRTIKSSTQERPNGQKCPPIAGTREAGLPCPLHRLGPRRLLGRPPAAEPGHPLLVRLHLHVHSSPGGRRPRQLH